MKKHIYPGIMLFICCGCGAGYAGNIYVNSATGNDANPGTQSLPYKTIQKAALNAQAGDTVLIAGGMYREANIAIRNGGTSAAPIIFKALDSNDKPILEGTVLLPRADWRRYQGNIYKANITWIPKNLYFRDAPLFIAQDPNQENPDDQTEITYFKPVPFAENSVITDDPRTSLIDSSYFTQPDDFWNNAKVLIYMGVGSNITSQFKITDYIAAEHKIILQLDDLNPWHTLTTTDKYAIRNHLAVLDKPGEWVIDTTTTPYALYVWPCAGQDIAEVAVQKSSTAFDFNAWGSHDYVVFDGLELRNYGGHALQFNVGTGKSAKYARVKNCLIHHNGSNGIYARNNAQGLSIESSKIYSNRTQGIGLVGGSNYAIIGNDISKNLENGIWLGNGTGLTETSPVFNVTDVIIKGNYIHHQDSHILHPDNMQFVHSDNVRIEANTLEQEGNQNMWLSYNGRIYLRNNIFINGVVGINNAIESYLHNNIIYHSTVRYDCFQSNSVYRAAKAVVRNNAIIESSIDYPAETLWEVPRWPIFQFDHNLYYKSGSWNTEGFGKDSIVSSTAADLPAYFINPNPPFDFHLASNSPLIDHGNNFSDPAISQDREGNARFQGAAIDIGPYETPGVILPVYPPEDIPEEDYIPDNPGAGIFLEDFELRFLGSGDLSPRRYAWGLSWQKINNNAAVEAAASGSRFLSLPPNGGSAEKALIIANEGFAWNNYTLKVDIMKYWSPVNPGIVVLYKDPTNYYFLNIRNGSMVKRVNDTDVILGTNGALGIAHADSAMHNYAVSVAVDAGTATFKARKDGGNEIIFVDTSPHVAAGTIGFLRDANLRINVDNIRVETSSGSIRYGDVSGDNGVSAYDAALAAQAAVGMIPLTAEQARRADVSGGGGVSAYDAALIAQYAVGLIDIFPVE